MKISEILFKAADLIEPEGAWTQGPVAVDADGNETFAADPHACSWCMLGAIWRYAGNSFGERWRAEEAVHPTLGSGLVSIGAWNDDPDRTQAEVVAKLREAAEKAAERGK